MLVGIFEGQIVLRQFFSFEWFVETSFAKGTESESLLFYLDQTSLAKRMSTVEISRNPVFTIKVFVT